MNTKKYLNKIIKIKIDRPLASTHPKHNFYYPINYGYVENTISGDGEELDAYLLGVFEPVKEYTGKVIAIIHRTNDNDDKLVVVPPNTNYTDEQIRALTEFQERYFESIILRQHYNSKEQGDNMIKLNNLECINKDIDINNYISFRDKVKSNMEHPEWLGDFSETDLSNIINNNGKIWIYKLNNNNVCSMMIIPSSQKDMEKFKLNLDYKKVIDYGPMFVDFNYIGNNLQYQMLQVLDKEMINNNYTHALVTVHPDNKYSINNILKDDFKLINTLNLKRGPRNIYIKELIKR